MNTPPTWLRLAKRLTRGPRWDLVSLLAVLFLFILVLFSLLPMWYARPKATSQVPMNLHAKETADYGKDPLGTTVPGVDLGIIRALLHDENPSASDLDQRFATLSNELMTPVSTSTVLSPVGRETASGSTATQGPGLILATPSSTLSLFPPPFAESTSTGATSLVIAPGAGIPTTPPPSAGSGTLSAVPSSTPTETGTEVVQGTPTQTLCETYPSSGYADTQDTWIDATRPTSSNAGQSTLQVEPQPREKRALIKFDLREIPQGSVIDSATLYVEVTSPSASTVNFYEILDPWTENVTWQNRPGPAQPNPQDDVVVGTLTLTSTQPGHCVRSIPLDTDLVEYWANYPIGNYGIMMVVGSGTEKSEYTGREGITGPILVVAYTFTP